MAWDTARTRQLLLDAAVEEYATHGPEGARMDRIAANACVNKERIYQYFGNKRQLFGTVLTGELERLAAAVPLTPELAADLGEYAGRVYDYHLKHPHLIRLMHWEGLLDNDGAVPAEAERTAHYAAKVATLAGAQRAGAIAGDVAPAHLMYAVMALAGWWFAVPQIIRMLVAGDPDDGPESRRAGLVALVRKLVMAR
ncbi:TetR family transcriptional regulator [Solihabitans fulvus]|uniref:TetR family transcriptional regulator n=1 Tax=Solihabitans fulvus TaxID=1892852 RepID=A0A5B2WLD9_9PSEU|nr:TetR family transcriptional regulator [Solihabitans fulvus]KAA2252591.1 TetR family transcriptional regulator [Solihabitans fulvus]